MHPEKLKRASIRLSWLLRHGAIESRLTMNSAGWAAIADVRRLARLSRPMLDDIVANNNKSRLQIDGDHIRASQGHSLSGTPVTQEALEASWAAWSGTTSLWHGTRAQFIPSIARKGLLPQSRTHVHLAESTGSHVGKRANVGVLLEISPSRVRAANQVIYRSPNGVILIRHVPADSIIALRPLTQRARKSAPSLREALGV